MQRLQIIFWSTAIFFCLWAGLLARLKGYSATCWLLGGGPVGVIVLCRLPSVSGLEPTKRRSGNRLGLVFSGLSVLAFWASQNFL
jgi:hypothetical protein